MCERSTVRSMSRRMGIGRALCAVAAVLVAGAAGGCRMPSAGLQLLGGLETALEDVSAGQQVIRTAVMTQLQGQQEALDAAFEADLRNLAARAAVDEPDAGEAAPGGAVKLADVLTAKRLYDARRAEIQASREGVGGAFDRLDNNLAASREMVDMLRRLTLQQHLLAGQAELAVANLLSRQRVEQEAAGQPETAR